MLLKKFTAIALFAGVGVAISGAIASAQYWNVSSSPTGSTTPLASPSLRFGHQSGMMQPGMMQPGMQPGMMQSGMMQPGMMQPGMMRMGMMDQGQIQNEFDFLSHMIPHHQEAIDTATIILERSTRPEMQAFAQSIIEVQSAEIEQMQAWLEEWYPGQTTMLAYTPMMRDLSQLDGDALDKVFLQDMIHHHHMAVMMSYRVVNHGLVDHEAVRPFAQQIASDQMTEIDQMQIWLQDWFGTTGMMPTRHWMQHF